MKKEIMEPSDFDKILREKVLENHDLHQQEMESARPFVWTAVSNEIGRKKSLNWYHLAAAIALLMITFSVVLVNLQKNHQQEIELLSNKIDQLEKSFVTQAERLQSKDAQLTSIKNELENVEMRFSSMDQQLPLPVKESIVYRTDTVFVKQVEYVTVVEKNENNEALTAASDVNENQNVAIVQGKEITTDDEIFPSSRFINEQKKSETVKLTFSPFTSRNN